MALFSSMWSLPQIEIANAAIRQAIKPTAAALAGAGGTVNLALPENALQAVWLALPIGGGVVQ